MAESKYLYAIGRRKTSKATIRLFEKSGTNTLNDKTFNELYPSRFEQKKLNEAFQLAELDPKEYSFTARASGGGHSSQLDAIVLALSRAISNKYPEKKKALKDAGLLTRDQRMVERKKPGLKKARKSEQYSKR